MQTFVILWPMHKWVIQKNHGTFFTCVEIAIKRGRQEQKTRLIKFQKYENGRLFVIQTLTLFLF